MRIKQPSVGYAFRATLLGLFVCQLSSAAYADNVLLLEQFETSPVGWTVMSNGYGGWSSGSGNPGGCFILNNAGELSSDPTLMRTVEGLQIGRRYRIAGDFKDHYNYCPQPSQVSFRVELDGVTVYSSARVLEWTRFSYEWNASAVQVTLRIRAETDGTDCDAALDNITLTEVSPPCRGDVSGNSMVDGIDLAAILSNWGTAGDGQFDTDINDDGTVDGTDLAFVLGGWGPCP